METRAEGAYKRVTSKSQADRQLSPKDTPHPIDTLHFAGSKRTTHWHLAEVWLLLLTSIRPVTNSPASITSRKWPRPWVTDNGYQSSGTVCLLYPPPSPAPVRVPSPVADVPSVVSHSQANEIISQLWKLWSFYWRSSYWLATQANESEIMTFISAGWLSCSLR